MGETWTRKDRPLFNQGDYVYKEDGDYVFRGVVVCVFWKLSGVVRYVVENEGGIVHIFNAQQIKKGRKLA